MTYNPENGVGFLRNPVPAEGLSAVTISYIHHPIRCSDRSDYQFGIFFPVPSWSKHPSSEVHKSIGGT